MSLHRHHTPRRQALTVLAGLALGALWIAILVIYLTGGVEPPMPIDNPKTAYVR